MGGRGGSRRLDPGKLPADILAAWFETREQRSKSSGVVFGPATGEDTAVIDPQLCGDSVDSRDDLLVVTSDPMYYIYCHFLERKGFEVVTVPESAHGLQAEAVARKLEQLGDRCELIRFFYAVTVNNPSASILANAERRKLVQLVTGLSSRLKRRVPLVLDKAYEDLVHDPDVEPPQSGLLHDEAGLVYEVGTLSKILAPSLRIGYMIGRDGPLLRCLVQKTSDSGFSAPLICQEMASYLLDNYLDEQLSKVKKGYRDKARAVKHWIDEYLGTGLAECRGGQAGFYFYLTFKDVETHEQSRFFRFLTRTTGNEVVDGPPADRHARVIYIPGEFCVHTRGDRVREGKRQLRISYGFEETPQIGRALALMREALGYAHAG